MNSSKFPTLASSSSSFGFDGELFCVFTQTPAHILSSFLLQPDSPLSKTVPAMKDSSESCSALQAYSARAFLPSRLHGDTQGGKSLQLQLCVCDERGATRLHFMHDNGCCHVLIICTASMKHLNSTLHLLHEAASSCLLWFVEQRLRFCSRPAVYSFCCGTTATLEA